MIRLFYTDEQRAFADEVRAWVRANLNPHTREKMLNGGRISFGDLKEWWQTLHAKGWGAPAWPVEHGGTGWDVIRRSLFTDICHEEGAPNTNVWALNMIGPVLLTFGNEEQKARYLPRMLDVSDFWAQGFSEPGAGSDLANLKTRAEDKGDHWLVNGQKLWTTYAQFANKIFLLVRTDPQVKPQQGISLLLADMATPGITVRPVITIDGEHEVNEVFLDDVKIPKENIVGVPGQGWDIAKSLLSTERVGIAQVGKLKRNLARIKAIAADMPAGHGSKRMIDCAHVRTEIAMIEAELMGIEISNLRMLMAEKVYAEASMLKLKSSEIEQKQNELMMELGGPVALLVDEGARDHLGQGLPAGPPYAPSLAPEYFRTRAATIYGGTSEVQHNIIARTMLGL